MRAKPVAGAAQVGSAPGLPASPSWRLPAGGGQIGPGLGDFGFGRLPGSLLSTAAVPLDVFAHKSGDLLFVVDLNLCTVHGQGRPVSLQLVVEPPCDHAGNYSWRHG